MSAAGSWWTNTMAVAITMTHVKTPVS